MKILVGWLFFFHSLGWVCPLFQAYSKKSKITTFQSSSMDCIYFHYDAGAQTKKNINISRLSNQTWLAWVLAQNHQTLPKLVFVTSTNRLESLKPDVLLVFFAILGGFGCPWPIYHTFAWKERVQRLHMSSLPYSPNPNLCGIHIDTPFRIHPKTCRFKGIGLGEAQR